MVLMTRKFSACVCTNYPGHEELGGVRGGVWGVCVGDTRTLNLFKLRILYTSKWVAVQVVDAIVIEEEIYLLVRENLPT